MKYYSIVEFSNLIGKTEQTLRNWDKNGTLKPHHVAHSGHRYYSQQQLNHFLGIKSEKATVRKAIGYCRVSSHKQKDDLERQVDTVKTYMIARGYQFEIIQDIGSGINYNKKGLTRLIDLITNSEVDRVVVLYKDRLLRFGFELVEHLCEKYGTTIEIIDNTEKTDEQEQKMWQSVGTARFIYNWTLARQRENYNQGGKFISDNDLRKQITQLKKNELSWLNEVSNNVAKQAVKDACDAYKRFFKGLADKPRFKSRKKSKPTFYNDNVKLKVQTGFVLIEKVGWIKIKPNQLPIFPAII